MFMAAAAALLMVACGSKKEEGNKDKKSKVEKLKNVSEELEKETKELKSASLSTEMDSLMYALGIAQTQGFEEYAFTEMGLNQDSAYRAELILGIIDGANLAGSEKDAAYFAGIGIGQQLSSNLKRQLAYQIFGEPKDSLIEMDNFFAGFVSALKGEKTNMSVEEAQMAIERLMPIVKESQYKDFKAENEKFMVDIAKKDSVQTLEDGVCYKVLTQGNGATPKATDRVKVHYEGKTIDGNVFDSSYNRGEPVEFGCSQVIKGWTTALINMPVGSKWEVYIPQEVAYGSQGSGPIKPYSTLIFTIELLEIVK